MDMVTHIMINLYYYIYLDLRRELKNFHQEETHLLSATISIFAQYNDISLELVLHLY